MVNAPSEPGLSEQKLLFENKIGEETERFMQNIQDAIAKVGLPEYSMSEIEAEMKSILPVLGILSQKWTIQLIFLLGRRSLKFNELKKILRDISSRTLTDKLRILEKEKLLKRKIIDQAPVRVEYSLTEKGKFVALSSIPLLYNLRKLNKQS